MFSQKKDFLQYQENETETPKKNPYILVEVTFFSSSQNGNPEKPF